MPYDIETLSNGKHYTPSIMFSLASKNVIIKIDENKKQTVNQSEYAFDSHMLSKAEKKIQFTS